MATILNADTITGGLIATGDSSGELELQAAGTTKISVTSSGAAVTGLNATGMQANGLTYPTSDGTADQVLVTNGSGTLSFADAATSALTLIANESIVSGTTQYDFTGLSAYRHLQVIVSHTTTGGSTSATITMGLSSGTADQNPRDDSYNTAKHEYEVGGAHTVQNGSTSGITAGSADANKPYYINCSIMNFNDSSERTTYYFTSVHNQSFNSGSNGGGYINQTEAYDYLRITLNNSDSNTGKIMVLGVEG